MEKMKQVAKAEVKAHEKRMHGKGMTNKLKKMLGK